MEDKVEVPLNAAQVLEDIKRISDKGHSADVKYIKRENKWVVYDVGKTKINR